MKTSSKSIAQLNENYDLELDKAVDSILNSKSKLVLLQFPDGLKPYALSIVDYLSEKTKGKVEFLIWMESCYGACDLPVGLESMKPKIDLIIHFGHNEMMPSSF